MTGTLLTQVFRQYQLELVTTLPLNDANFVTLLEKNNFFYGDQKATVQAQKTEADKASHFLDSVISRCIEEYFIRLLNVMEVYGGGVESLAHNIKEKLGISKYDYMYTIMNMY